MSVTSFYERNYGLILKGLAGGAICAAVFLAGYARGANTSVPALIADLAAAAAGVLGAAWEQTAETDPVHFLQVSRKPGAGVTLNALPERGELILMTGFFDGMPGLRLIRRDGTVVAAWRAAFSELAPELRHRASAPKTDWNIDLHGTEMEPDGSVLFNFEYQATVKLSRCGAREWILPERSHHTISPAAAGGVWIAGRAVLNAPDDPAYHPMTNPLRDSGWIEDDELLHVSAEGEVLARKSVFRMMMENGLEPLLTANGLQLRRGVLADNEILHLNHIEELSPELAPAFPMFEAGDLLLSVHDFNLVMVVDPDEWKVKWHSVGPWVRQHSARFLPDGTIAVFNNNAYTYALDPAGRDPAEGLSFSDVRAVDPGTGAEHVVYGDRAGEDLASVERGFIQPTVSGGLMITETAGGRAFEIDRDRRVVWEYINRHDDARVLEITSAELYPAGYFTVTDWSCP